MKFPASRLPRRAMAFWLILALLAPSILLPAGGIPPAGSPSPAARLAEGLLSCETVIDLTPCRLPVSELGQVYADLLYSRPELFHVALRLSYTSREITQAGETRRIVTEVYPAYTLTGAQLTAARRLYRDTVTAILLEMEATFAARTASESSEAPSEAEPSAEAEAVLYLHDLLADRYTYDIRAESPDPAVRAQANADAYTFFRDGRGVCQAYALAFIALARGAGLEADFVASSAMNHAWNHVRVDGVWYHVDVTRDDPIPATGGGDQVNHTRLLRSDEGMAALGYHGYTCASGHACTDTRYEPQGVGALEGFSAPLTVFSDHWAGLDAEGCPVAVTVGSDGLTLGQPGDMDEDGTLTPADLLTVCDPLYPEEWRKRLRALLVE